KPGNPGNPCPAPSSTLQIVNGDTSNSPWDSVQVSKNGGPLVNATKSGATYTIDLTGVATTSVVRIIITFTVATTKHIAVFDGPAAWFLAMASNPTCAVSGSSAHGSARTQSAVVNCPLPIATKFWGAANGKVTFSDAGLTSQAMVRVG